MINREETHSLQAREYDNLFPDGMDFVSFECVLYEKSGEGSIMGYGIDVEEL